MSTFTTFEKCYIFFAKLLGADIYKKYSPFGGSWWNTNHHDKNSIFSMEQIIADANLATQSHAQSMVMEGILMGSIFLGLPKDIRNLYLRLYIPLTGIHKYGFMIHHYNRILARKRIEELKEKDKVETDSVEVTTDENIQKNSLRNEKYKKLDELNKNNPIKIHFRDFESEYYFLSFDLKTVGPDFDKLDDALSFRNKIYEVANDKKTISEYMYLNGEFKDVYIKWKEEMEKGNGKIKFQN